MDDWREDILHLDTVRVRVTPRAASNRIEAERQPDLSWLVKIHTTTVPEDNKANDEVIRLLGRELGVPKSSLTITRGLTSRDKTIKIAK